MGASRSYDAVRQDGLHPRPSLGETPPGPSLSLVGRPGLSSESSSGSSKDCAVPSFRLAQSSACFPSRQEVMGSCPPTFAAWHSVYAQASAI